MNAPAIESAVHTTPPMIRAATIPPVPFMPTATITTEASINVISVIPDTGLVPTMAIALAATVVKRKAIRATSTIPTMANVRLPSITPNQKNRKVRRIVIIDPKAITLNEMSCCVRSSFFSPFASPFSPLISLAANDTALFIIPHDFIMPMMPAMAMPPIPMLLP